MLLLRARQRYRVRISGQVTAVDNGVDPNMFALIMGGHVIRYHTRTLVCQCYDIRGYREGPVRRGHSCEITTVNYGRYINVCAHTNGRI